MTSPEAYMARAIQLAERGLYTTDPNPRVGCVIVNSGEIVGEGWHQWAGEGHAEVNALFDAGEKADGADCYVTLEPCSHYGRTAPCVDAVIKAGIKRVFIGMVDPNPIVSGSGIERLREAGIEVHVPILSEQAESLNPGFNQRMRHGRPFVRAKIAMSLDGRTAMASGQSKWITGKDARTDVQKWRARSSAVLTGIGTVLADDPLLNLRPEQFNIDWYPEDRAVRQPRPIVVDSQLRIPKESKIFQREGLIIATAVAQTIENDRVDTLHLPEVDGMIDLNALMSVLAKREINEILVEAGGLLNGALLKANLIDELIIYMAPKLMGDAAKGVFHLPWMQTMADNIDLHIKDIRAVGRDWRITAIPEYNEEM
jgi:diaminohydroxyphosphoribosylaminopyrimidine deaminase/5-amino-6-(5-phosphoribosylamino)uracil reductase